MRFGAEYDYIIEAGSMNQKQGKTKKRTYFLLLNS
jgi:hypothetical protein